MPSIRKRGDKWQVQVRRKGQRPITRSFLSKKDAQLWSRQMEAKADRHDLPPDLKVLEPYTLGDLVRRYRDEVTSKKRGNEQESYILNAFLRQPICSKRLSEVTPGDFAEYAEERLEKIKPVSLHRQLAPIHNLYEVARRSWQLPIRENPLDSLNVKAPQGRRERRLSAGEFERLIQATERCSNHLIEPIIRFAIETGMRRGEILAIRSDHIDWHRRSLLIPQTNNGHPRVIPLKAPSI